MDVINQNMKAILAHQSADDEHHPAASNTEGAAWVGRVDVTDDEVTVKQYEYRMLIDDYMT